MVLIISAGVLFLLTSAIATKTPADLLCSYGGKSYKNTDLIPHANGCTELQCQFGQVIAYWEACGKEINGECHAAGSSFKHEDITYECQRTVVADVPIYRNVRITPVYVGCQAEGKSYNNLDKFRLSDTCRLYQCQNGVVRVVEPACGKEVDGSCHDLDTWFLYNEKFYECIAAEENGQTIYVNRVKDPQPPPRISCNLGGTNYKNLEYKESGCNMRQCQSGKFPHYLIKCKFYKDQGQCYTVGEQWIFQKELYECKREVVDGKERIQAQTDDPSYLNCWLSETYLSHLDTIVVQDGCGLRQCLNGTVPFLKNTCTHYDKCYSVGSIWTIDGVTRKCIVTSYGYRKVVRVDENGTYDEGEKPQPPDIGEIPPYEGCPAIADIIFVIDSSRSLSQMNFHMELTFASNISNFFKIGPNDVRFGAVVFSDEAQKVFDLKDHTDSATVKEALEATPFLRGKTRTDRALNLIVEQDMFGTASGGRDEADNIVIIMTDGDSDDTDMTLHAADRLKTENIDIITVGVGFIHADELIGMASRYENAFLALSFDVLGTLLNAVSRRACDTVDKCKDDPCEHFCDGTETGFICTCKEGFVVNPDDSTKCDDVDECKQHPCQHTCTNTEGSFKCSCDDGYMIDLTDITKCLDIDECASSGSSPCEQNCRNVPGSFECSCMEGYEVDHNDATQCVDKDECKDTANPPCEHICSNSEGSYECSCKDGYVKDTNDPNACEDKDECKDTANPPCEQICSNSEGSYECSCKDGYVKDKNDPNACEDKDECKDTANPPCEQICSNTEGSYECSCKDGYVKDTNDPNACEDKDECKDTANPPCEQICSNTEGSYECSCKDGYVKDTNDPNACEDVDECAINDDSPCQQNCTNLEGSFKCTCFEGFVINQDDYTKCDKLVKCKTKADIILIFDASSSILIRHFNKQFDFAKRLIRHFDIGPDDVRFAGIVFSRSVKKLFDLKDNDDYDSLDKALTGIEYMNSSTYTDRALQMVTWYNMFDPVNGGRDEAKDIIILITDGDANYQEATRKAAQLLKDQGILIMAIAVGPQITIGKLEEVVSSPNDIAQAVDYDRLDYIEQRVAKLACTVNR